MHSTDPLLYTRTEVSAKLGLGRTKTDQLIRSGELRSVKIGRARRIPVSALREYVERLRQDQTAS